MELKLTKKEIRHLKKAMEEYGKVEILQNMILDKNLKETEFHMKLYSKIIKHLGLKTNPLEEKLNVVSKIGKAAFKK